jgi:hypothetical protein
MNTYMTHYFLFSGTAAQRGLWPPRPRSFMITHNDAPQSVGIFWTSDQLVAETSTRQHPTHTTNIHTPGGIRTRDRSSRAAVDLSVRSCGSWDRPRHPLQPVINESVSQKAMFDRRKRGSLTRKHFSLRVVSQSVCRKKPVIFFQCLVQLSVTERILNGVVSQSVFEKNRLLFSSVLDSWYYQPVTVCIYRMSQEECARLRKVFLMLKYTDITQNAYIQTWTVTEIMTTEKCDLLSVPCTVPVQLTRYRTLRM